jgi:hypothetical protein
MVETNGFNSVQDSHIFSMASLSLTTISVCSIHIQRCRLLIAIEIRLRQNVVLLPNQKIPQPNRGGCKSQNDYAILRMVDIKLGHLVA